jgi:hypothetical protein
VFFEGHDIKNSKWLDNLSRLPLERVRQTLRDLGLIDKRTDKGISRVQKVRNDVVHDMLASAKFSFPEEAGESYFTRFFFQFYHRQQPRS